MKGRFADSLEPEFEKTKKELGDKAKSDEDVLSYIAFPRWPWPSLRTVPQGSRRKRRLPL